MADTFKAVDGFTHGTFIQKYADGDDITLLSGVAVFSDPKRLLCEETPCTIIPGHWAERIESGELLTDADILLMFGSDALHGLGGELILSVARDASQAIARKLRGEV